MWRFEVREVHLKRQELLDAAGPRPSSATHSSEVVQSRRRPHITQAENPRLHTHLHHPAFYSPVQPHSGRLLRHRCILRALTISSSRLFHLTAGPQIVRCAILDNCSPSLPTSSLARLLHSSILQASEDVTSTTSDIHSSWRSRLPRYPLTQKIACDYTPMNIETQFIPPPPRDPALDGRPNSNDAFLAMYATVTGPDSTYASNNGYYKIPINQIQAYNPIRSA
jgi:hypothetical protein